MLNEALSPIVYHFTRIDAAQNILSKGKFSMTLALSNPSEMDLIKKKEKLYYMSTFRSLGATYHRGENEGVIFALDGEMISRRYAAEPVNYWHNPDSFSVPKEKGHELEDRIFTENPWMTIRPGMIKAIHIKVRPDSSYNFMTLSDIQKKKFEALKLIATIKKLNIPYYVYEDSEDWYHFRTGKSIPNWAQKNIPSLSLKAMHSERKFRYADGGEVTDADRVEAVIEVLRQNDWKNLSRLGKDIIELAKKGSLNGSTNGGLDFVAYIRRDAKDETKKAVSKLTAIMKEFHVNNLKDLGNLITTKWEKIIYGGNLDQAMSFGVTLSQKVKDRLQQQLAKKTANKKLPKIAARDAATLARRNKAMDDALEDAFTYNKKIDDKINSQLGIKESYNGNIRLNVYHGTNAQFKQFSDKKKRIVNDHYGGGVAYFTDNEKIAWGYAIAMTRKYGGDQYLYHVELSFKNIFDVDSQYTGNEISSLMKYVKPEDFARGAGLLGIDSDKYIVLDNLRTGKITLSGDQIYKGLSKGMIHTNAAEDVLKKVGFDGLRYNGGIITGSPRHNVYIAYYPESIRITALKRKKIVVKEDLEMPEIGHMTFSRDLLPQIEDQDEFMDHLKLIGITHTKKKLSTDDLKATQSNGFNMNKVKAMVDSGTPGRILVSNDGYILDGHHRWIAAYNTTGKVNAIVFDAPILELIRIAADFHGSILDTLDEAFNDLVSRTNPVLFHHFDARKGKDIVKRNALEGKHTHTIPQFHKIYDKKTANDRYDNNELVSPWMDEDEFKNVTGTSFSRNIHLSFQADEKRFILELDRNKIKATNKIHVIDADFVVQSYKPNINVKRDYSPSYHGHVAHSRQRPMELHRKGVHQTKSNHINDFAEEFVSGDIQPLNKYIKTIWLKDEMRKWATNHTFYDMLAKYVMDYNIPIKYYPSGKDATEDLIDFAESFADKSIEVDNDPYMTKVFKDMRPPKDQTRFSNTIVAIRKSINTKANKL